jgi:dolichol-phosphate mannosyltransferase
MGSQLVSDFTLILPTLNERENIGRQLKAVFEALPDIAQIIVVDDNSADGTTESVRNDFAREIASKIIALIDRRRDFGLTPSLREALSVTRTRYVGWMDCDLSMPPALFPEMLKRIEMGHDICIGTRFGRGGKQKQLGEVQEDSRAEILLSNLLNAVMKAFIRLPITDYTSGFIVARRELLEKIELRGTHGEYFMDLMFQAGRLGARLTEIPYECGNRQFGKSKTFGSLGSSLKNSYRYSSTVLKVLCGKYTGLRT